MTQTDHKRGSWVCKGEAPIRCKIFGNFLEKIAILMPLGHISHEFRAICKNRIFGIWKQIDSMKLFNPPFTYDLSPKHV